MTAKKNLRPSVHPSHKVCRTCQRRLPVAAFHQHKYRSQKPTSHTFGYTAHCKRCTGLQQRRAYTQRLRHTRAQYRQQHAERIAQAVTLRRRRHPELARVYNQVQYALKHGKLVRPMTCQDCGRTCKPDAHHEDYAQPLIVRWLCRTCHGKTYQKYVEPPLETVA